MVKRFLILCVAVFLAVCCDKEDRKNTYANQEIQKAANPKVVQMDMQQAKQFIELTKGQVK